MRDASVTTARWMVREVQMKGRHTFKLRRQTAEDLIARGFAILVDGPDAAGTTVRMSEEQAVMFLLFDGEQS